MSSKPKQTELPIVTWKNESSRQRWELFHRAIAHAKESNNEALSESDSQASDGDSGRRSLLSIVR